MDVTFRHVSVLGFGLPYSSMCQSFEGGLDRSRRVKGDRGLNHRRYRKGSERNPFE